MEKSKIYESGRLYNGLKMTLDNDKNCIILRTRKKLKDIDPACKKLFELRKGKHNDHR